eukprot:5219519-Heterocapsa_arctica.AAC.1
MTVYDEAVDNLVRGIGKEGTKLFEDEPAGAFISERTAKVRRAKSQDPGQYGSDANASETTR